MKEKRKLHVRVSKNLKKIVDIYYNYFNIGD